MSSNTGVNHLISRRVQSGFGKNKDFHSKSRKIKDKSTESNLEGMNFNQSVDMKIYMTREKYQMGRRITNNTINVEPEAEKGRRGNSLLFMNSKRQPEGANERSVKLAYGSTSPKAIRQRVSTYTSAKSIKQKKKRLQFSTHIREQSELYEQMSRGNSPTVHGKLKQNHTVNIQKHMIIQKYEKAKLLLKQEKYSQASIYLKQILPYIQDKNKKKQLYFWLIASLMKFSPQGKSQTIENYIIDCLDQFPNFYDIYLYWAKIKLSMHQVDDSIQIYQKAISINDKNSQAYAELANIYIQEKSYKQALNILQEGFNKSINSISIPVKIIENHHIFNLNLNQHVLPYLQRIQSNCGKKNTEFLYVQGFIQYSLNNFNQALIYFLESLKYDSSKNLATKSLEYVIKIHISKKDFYAACYDLKRAKHLNIDAKKIERYETFLQGVNFVMKKKNQDGIKLLNKIKDSVTKPNSKKKINSFFTIVNQSEDEKIPFFSQDSEIFSLTVQYLAYAYFKLGDHKQTIKCYKLLEKVTKKLDKTSKYNMLLAEGIVLADKNRDFDMSYAKFQQAKTYLGRVEPWIYQAMVTVQKRIYEHKTGEKKKIVFQSLAQEELNTSVIQALNLMDEGFQVNSSSSNLLYHRTILHLYFSSLKSAMNDINVCIQKAQQNLPKYFYLRGICFACMKNLKKAINQFSISISLSKQYSISYLQRAKCYFLSGETEMGFQDLKIYMDQCPDDYHVHKWIGDLLFQGTSYNDSIKAYNQMGDKITLDALCMRLKAELRVGTFKQVNQTMNKIKSHELFDQHAFGIDLAAYHLFSSLMNQQNTDKQIMSIEKKVKELNDYLESDVQKGKIFNLVDCMCLVGIGSFYIEKYLEAYEAFILVFEFFKSTSNKNAKSDQEDEDEEDISNSVSQGKNQKLNTEIQEENLDLREQDIYFNLFLCLLAMKDFQAVKKLADEEMMGSVSSKTQKKVIEKILAFINESNEKPKKPGKQKSNLSSFSQAGGKNAGKQKSKKDSLSCLLEPRIQTSLNSNLRKFDISIPLQKNTLNLKTSLIWSPYHSTNENLNFTSMAKNLVKSLHAGYIDNMPQGPWIRRNEFGVLFTDNILEEGNESSFITTARNEEEGRRSPEEKDYEDDDIDEEDYNFSGSLRRFETENSEKIEHKKKAFLKEMKLDLKIEDKLNKIIKKNDDNSNNTKSNDKI